MGRSGRRRQLRGHHDVFIHSALTARLCGRTPPPGLARHPEAVAMGLVATGGLLPRAYAIHTKYSRKLKNSHASLLRAHLPELRVIAYTGHTGRSWSCSPGRTVPSPLPPPQSVLGHHNGDSLVTHSPATASGQFTERMYNVALRIKPILDIPASLGAGTRTGRAPPCSRGLRWLLRSRAGWLRSVWTLSP